MQTQERLLPYLLGGSFILFFNDLARAALPYVGSLFHCSPDPEKGNLTLPDEILGVLSATYPGYHRATVIKEHLEKLGHDMNKYRNPLAIIHMVLKLLIGAKKVETAENKGGQKLYRISQITSGATADPCLPHRQ